ncbi:hypothetical protein PAXRUDRAFT_143520, partial [Paxillus rubicundulus Ve08.2h10]
KQYSPAAAAPPKPLNELHLAKTRTGIFSVTRGDLCTGIRCLFPPRIFPYRLHADWARPLDRQNEQLFYTAEEHQHPSVCDFHMAGSHDQLAYRKV